MSELDRLRDLDGLTPPDLWPDVLDRDPRPLRQPSARRRLATGAIATVAGTAAVLLTTQVVPRGSSDGTVPPSALPRNGKIAFIAGGAPQRDADGTGHVYLVDPDGGKPERLPLQERVRELDWAPDGSRFAATGAEFSRTQLGVAGLTDGALTPLTPETEVGQLRTSPAWSPDGHLIAFAVTETTGEPSDPSIHVMRPDGTGVRRITECDATTCPPGYRDLGADWSPDGTRLVVGRHNQLILVDADGSDEQTLFACSEPCFQVTHPAWSPSGDLIAFVWTSADFRSEVRVVGVDGGGARTVYACGRLCLSPEWSPDGRLLAVTNLHGGPANSSLMVMSPDGSNVRRIDTDLLGPLMIAWQPRPDAAAASIAGTGVPSPPAWFRFHLVTGPFFRNGERRQPERHLLVSEAAVDYPVALNRLTNDLIGFYREAMARAGWRSDDPPIHDTAWLGSG